MSLDDHPIKERCVIRLSENDAPKVTLAKDPPSAARFLLIPQHKPDLAQQIHRVSWCATKKQLHVWVSETADLSVVEWIEFIHKRQKQIKEGPFVDLDQDALTLELVDGRGEVLGRVKFKNLSLEGHEVGFDRAVMETLVHYLIIGYQEYERIRVKRRPVTDDDEWRTVEA